MMKDRKMDYRTADILVIDPTTSHPSQVPPRHDCWEITLLIVTKKLQRKTLPRLWDLRDGK
jgi:hypothetical protein